MLDIRKMRLLRDLARLGTIAAVAQAHRYTPSAVSQQLTALEREAGVELLTRTGRRVELTPAATVLVQHVESVLGALESAEAALAAARRELSGPVRIGAFPTAVRSLLPAALVALGRDHPRLELMVTELDPVAVPAALRERRVDVALINDYDLLPITPDPALDSVSLVDETVFLATAEHIDPGPDPVAGVGEQPWILATAGTACHAVTLQACWAAGYHPAVRHHIDDIDAVLALVAAGHGVSLVPELAAADPPAGVRLTPLPIRRRIRIAYRRGSAAHPVVAACVAALRSVAGHGPTAVAPVR